ncbi:DUF1642 domain-containing protein [Fructilactobacillus sp. Tb1]|uniref:DUF1642 domain-containing protein n=1 Tax=Fructilactobacillus sp. Tb1 TaxID=3422304 RepID=UPI003D284A11
MTKKEIELPIIPQFVADYVNLFKIKYSMYGAELLTLYGKDVPLEIRKWLSKSEHNATKFISAILYDYEIGNPKYVIKSPLLDKDGCNSYLVRKNYSKIGKDWTYEVDDDDIKLNYYTWQYKLISKPIQFTMEEIESDPQLKQLKQFAVEVEDD